MSIPPLGQGVLDAAEQGIGGGSKGRRWHRQIVHQVQHGNRDDKGQVEPIGYIDVRLFTLPKRTKEYKEIGHPNDRQPQIDMPSRFGIFLARRDAHQIARCGQYDKELIPPEHKPRQHAAKQSGPASALDNVEAGGNQNIAAESKDNGRRVQGPETPKVQEAKLLER